MLSRLLAFIFFWMLSFACFASSEVSHFSNIGKVKLVNFKKQSPSLADAFKDSTENIDIQPLAKEEVFYLAPPKKEVHADLGETVTAEQTSSSSLSNGTEGDGVSSASEAAEPPKSGSNTSSPFSLVTPAPSQTNSTPPSDVLVQGKINPPQSRPAIDTDKPQLTPDKPVAKEAFVEKEESLTQFPTPQNINKNLPKNELASQEDSDSKNSLNVKKEVLSPKLAPYPLQTSATPASDQLDLSKVNPSQSRKSIVEEKPQPTSTKPVKDEVLVEKEAPLPSDESSNLEISLKGDEMNNDVLPFLTSDFFAGSLTNVTSEEDPMGTQRLLQVNNSRFSPSLLMGTSFKHTSNPDKAENPQRKNSTTLDLSVGLNLGLGEYAVGDYFVCAPAASLMQMRTYNDPLKKFDKDMRVYDADVFIAGLTAPLVLPNDFTVTLSHSYVAPSTFRGGRNMISYSNTPSITLTKNLPLDTGGMLILVAGMSYTFSNGDTLEEQIANQVYFNFLKAVMEQSGSSPSADYPANLQDGYSITLSASYIYQYSEKISIVPSISYQSFSFTEGLNSGRIDKTVNLGLSASYLYSEWLSFSLLGNYTTKSSNDVNTPEFDDFIFGGGINVNHAF
jgi:hypothetical protein